MQPLRLVQPLPVIPEHQLRDAYLTIDSLRERIQFLEQENQKLTKIVSRISRETSRIFEPYEEVVCLP